MKVRLLRNRFQKLSCLGLCAFDPLPGVPGGFTASVSGLSFATVGTETPPSLEQGERESKTVTTPGQPPCVGDLLTILQSWA
jgi:hypothetical protein